MEPRLIIEQKITVFANQYRIFAASADGGKGGVVAFAQQKRLAFKERVNFYSDESKQSLAFSMRAEKVMDIHGRFIIEDAAGAEIGSFKKEFKQSLINSTWSILSTDGQPVITVSESNQILAVVRRFGGFIPILGGVVEIVSGIIKYHFTFTNTTTHEAIGRYEKTALIRDHCRLSMTQQAYDSQDWRVLTAMAVALDALQDR